MNYRQWKKEYKKEHGYNPPVAEDKRKQRKKQAEQFDIKEIVSSIQGFDKTMNELVNAIGVCCGRGFEIIGEVFEELGEVFEELGEVFEELGEAMQKKFKN